MWRLLSFGLSFLSLACLSLSDVHPLSVPFDLSRSFPFPFVLFCSFALPRCLIVPLCLSLRISHLSEAQLESHSDWEMVLEARISLPRLTTPCCKLVEREVLSQVTLPALKTFKKNGKTGRRTEPDALLLSCSLSISLSSHNNSFYAHPTRSI